MHHWSRNLVRWDDTSGVGGQVTDAEFVHLKGLTKLGVLNLSETQVTDAGVASLKRALPNCEIFCF